MANTGISEKSLIRAVKTELCDKGAEIKKGIKQMENAKFLVIWICSWEILSLWKLLLLFKFSPSDVVFKSV